VPPLEISGFSWAENLAFDGLGNLYVSDSGAATITRIWLQDNVWQTELYFDGVYTVDGLASDGVNLFANIITNDKVAQVVRLPLGEPFATPEVLAELPYPGNGLELDVDGSLYVTTEGNFLPGTGAVYQVSPQSGTWQTYLSDLWAADGIAIDRDQRVLYVTQVVNNKVLVIDLLSGDVTRMISVARPKNHSLLDDIALSPDGSTLYGADFGRGEIMAIPLAGGSVSVVATGLQAPTSVLFGAGPSFDANTLYLTEGGGFTDTDTDQRVLQLP
jgi:sugar lactone lactonase YvrE